MDYLLGKCVRPKSTEDCVIIKPKCKYKQQDLIPKLYFYTLIFTFILMYVIARTFITGIAKGYYADYDAKNLRGYLTEAEYEVMLKNLNEAVTKFWPCPMSESIGYLFCPCSCGLSFCLPNICIKEGEASMRTQIEYYNEYRF